MRRWSFLKTAKNGEACFVEKPPQAKYLKAAARRSRKKNRKMVRHPFIQRNEN
jgi:hypothetical protein